MTVKSQQYNGFSLVMSSDGTPQEILIDGVISAWSQNNSRDFRKAFNQIAAEKDEVIIRIGTSYGGSMFEGNAIVATMMNSGVKVITVLESVAASMSGVIFMGGDERRIDTNAVFMTHEPSGGVSGSSDQLRSYASMMEKLLKNVINLFVKQTGKDEKDVKSWFKKGEDVWHDAQECLERGIATEIISTGKNAPKQLLDAIKSGDSTQIQDVINSLKDQSSKILKNNMDKLKQFIATMAVMLSLSADATQEEVTNKVTELVDSNKSLKNELKGFKDAQDAERASEAEALVNQMVESGKLPEHLREMQMKAFEDDHAKAKEAVMKVLGEASGKSDKPEGADGAKSADLPESVKSFLDGLNGEGKGAKVPKFEDLSEEQWAEIEEKKPKLAQKIIDNREGRDF